MHRLLLLSLCFAAAACAHATPVAPAPLSVDETPKLQAALVGSCMVTATQKLDGERKDAKGLWWTFAADGRGHLRIGNTGTPFGDFTYRLDGRNVMTTGSYKALRVDEYDGPTMKWFLYDISQYYWCTKKQ